MRCSVCDAVNREENKFCGMCGARVQGLPASAIKSRKCVSCGKVNEPDYQYCAMCGMRLERSGNVARAHGPETPLEKRQAQTRADVLLPTGTGGGERRGSLEPLTLADPVGIASPPQSSGVPRQSSRSAPRRPGGTSTSLLGLNDAPGTDVSYLLREERASRRVARKVVLLAVLAGVSAIAYSRWHPLYHENPGTIKQTGPAIADMVRGWFQRQEKPRPSVKGENVVKSAKADASQDDVSNSDDVTKGVTKKEGVPLSAGAQPATGAASQPEDAASNAGAVQPNKESPRTRGTARSRPVRAIVQGSGAGNRKPSFALIRAQKFLQGKGVPQNCEQGLVYLKAATSRNEAAAAVQMSALYSSGHCVRRDRVMAYRWLNSAHEQEPDNPWIQQNLDQLWGRMTPQERKQIVN